MRYLVAAVILLALLGCGYHFPGKSGTLPGGVQSLYVPLFVNKTAEPQLENLLSNDVSQVFSRSGRVQQVETLQQAEAILEGVIRSYSTKAVAYDQQDDISEYRSTVVVDAALRQTADGRLLWQGQISWDDEYLAADDKIFQEDLEREAMEEISLRIAEELLARMLDDF